MDPPQVEVGRAHAHHPVDPLHDLTRGPAKLVEALRDEALAETNRQQAQKAVLTVYDYDAGLARRLTSKVDEIFTEMRTAAATASEDPQQQPTPNNIIGQAAAAAEKPAQNVITDKRKYLEEKLGIRVSRGAFIALQNAGFSQEISALINQILLKI